MVKTNTSFLILVLFSLLSTTANAAVTLDLANSRMITQNTDGISQTAEASDYFGWAVTTGDYNGDGYDDVVTGIPFEGISGQSEAGAIQVIYGSSGGLSTQDEVFHQNRAGMAGTLNSHEHFGYAVATGDFDNDGFDDVAVGIPLDKDEADFSGSVQILYGSASGLSTGQNQLINQNSPSIVNSSEADDHFGYSLAVGDFNNDGFDDLAVGVPQEDIKNNSVFNGGAVHLIYGSIFGLATNNHLVSLASDGIGGTEAAHDKFGYALTAGDFDSDGFDDIAVGIPNRLVDGKGNAGAVKIIYGTATGIGTRDKMFSQNNLAGIPESNDHLGKALIAGDFNHDGFDDLVIGVENENVGNLNSAGAIHFILGSSSGLTNTSNEIFTQDDFGINQAESQAYFGSSFTKGDFNQDGIFDLAVGAFLDDDILGAGNIKGGTVTILSGNAAGLFFTQNVSQSTPHVGAIDEIGDNFGYSLTSGDYNGDGLADLIVGAPGEGINDILFKVGAIWVSYGMFFLPP